MDGNNDISMQYKVNMWLYIRDLRNLIFFNNIRKIKKKTYFANFVSNDLALIDIKKDDICKKKNLYDNKVIPYSK